LWLEQNNYLHLHLIIFAACMNPRYNDLSQVVEACDRKWLSNELRELGAVAINVGLASDINAVTFD